MRVNREAAALGVPVYSIFRGKIGAVDRNCQHEGRLTLIERIEDIQEKILLKRRSKPASPESKQQTALDEILNHIEEIIKLDLRIHPTKAASALGKPQCHANSNYLLSPVPPQLHEGSAADQVHPPGTVRMASKTGLRSTTDWSIPGSIMTQRCPTSSSANWASPRPTSTWRLARARTPSKLPNVMGDI